MRAAEETITFRLTSRQCRSLLTHKQRNLSKASGLIAVGGSRTWAAAGSRRQRASIALTVYSRATAPICGSHGPSSQQPTVLQRRELPAEPSCSAGPACGRPERCLMIPTNADSTIARLPPRCQRLQAGRPLAPAPPPLPRRALLVDRLLCVSPPVYSHWHMDFKDHCKRLLPAAPRLGMRAPQCPASS